LRENCLRWTNLTLAILSEDGLSSNHLRRLVYESFNSFMNFHLLQPVQGTSDADNWFQESDESNNSTWVDIRIRHGRAKIVGYGPTA
jgi:hypothetical protein